MGKFNRRDFIKAGIWSVAGSLTLGASFQNQGYISGESAIDMVKLGKTGISVPRLAFGTGSFGYRKTSAQHKLGEQKFVELAKYAFDKGIRFFETADMYGTQPLVGKALKVVPREKVTVLSKIMVYQHQDWYTPEPFQKSIDRFRKELDTDYIDILLLHCMVNSEWSDEYKRYMDDYSEAKEKGIIRKVGLSCHDLGALKVAATSPWADVVLARINHKGAKMDGSPEEIMSVLKTAKENGKGVLGMKIFGCGDLIREEEREKSLNYVIKSNNVHAMTIGFVNNEQIDDAVERIMRIVKS